MDFSYLYCTHAISIRQPWADLILSGDKQIEYRTWPLPRVWLGVPMYLHAGKAPAPDFADDTIPSERYGAILGIVRFSVCLRWDHRLGTVDQDGIQWSTVEPFVGPYGWAIDYVESLSEPIPYRGQLRIFRVTLHR